MIKAIIFDLDGVLVDATHWHYEALNKALQLFGYTITEEEHKSFYNGLPTRKKLEHLSKEKGLPLSLHAFINSMKQKYTQELIERSCISDFQKVFMLKKLKEKGFKLAVCSNAILASVEIMLKKARLLEYFDLVLSNEDIVNPKPSPDIYLKAFAKLSVKPDECVIVEDAEHGKKAALASGGHLLEVEGYYEVNYELVRDFLKSLEGKS